DGIDVGPSLGSGFLCDANGPAARVTLANGMSLLRQLSFFPDAQNPTYLQVPNIPFPLFPHVAPFFALLNAYVPVNANHTLTVSLSPGGSLLVNINLDALPSCFSAAPVLSQWKLLALVVCLLIGGAWMLGLRQSFYNALPLP